MDASKSTSIETLESGGNFWVTIPNQVSPALDQANAAFSCDSDHNHEAAPAAEHAFFSLHPKPKLLLPDLQ